ncbi:OLC1v1016255C1 [Oldenlandia corymbosa var. corymbosa]|uniref:OLC1v1016255C1 n=1 Tax=Oldenlandia corymbosa var. corymbosa TaxID=529605 RepID=A0AAV1E6T0_OLDCO|nr:OLC1v1016255C1 [Oldenlandia corymbosa var. corymbosa]
MDKKKWLWKRKSSERSPGETDSSGSISSNSERYSDEQEEVKSYPNHSIESPEVTSKVLISDDEVAESVKNLTAKLSAALVNVSVKEDLVKQHAKVAEEAVAGWEKAENEATILKQQLDTAVQQNLALEVRVNHLDCALKECVRQLRQAKDEQEQKIQDAVAQKSSEFETIKAQLENQILQLETNIQASVAQNSTFVDPEILQKMDFLEKENSVLKFELDFHNEELQKRTIERDLSTQAAEAASKQQLESIKKIARLAAECRRLQSVIRKLSTTSNNKSAASSVSAESVTGSQTDSVDHIIIMKDASAHKLSKLEPNEFERNHSDSWASALIAELDQFKNDKVKSKDFLGSSAKIDMMDDFLEMERLVASPQPQNGHKYVESETTADELSIEKHSKGELETMIHRLSNLEERLGMIEEEKNELEERLGTIEEEKTELEERLGLIEEEKTELEERLGTTEVEKTELQERMGSIEEEKKQLEHELSESKDSLMASQAQLTETEIRLKDLQKELQLVSEAKELLEFQLIGIEVEARSLKANVDTLTIEVQKEKTFASEMAVKCEDLEKELLRKSEEIVLQQTANANSDLKIKQVGSLHSCTFCFPFIIHLKDLTAI